MSAIEASLRLERGGFELALDLRLPARGVTAVWGPSGAGKTTLLRCFAGLDHAMGRIVVDGRAWQDDASGCFLPPHERRVGYVFQEASLFPHLDVRANLRFGLDRRPPQANDPRFDEVVDWLGVGTLLARRTSSLSGGERQRVAIARALLCGPRLLAMDEPLASLDETSRRAILTCLEELHGRLAIPVLFVSHSAREVARLADFVLVLEHGRERAFGRVEAVLADPEMAELDDEGGAAVVPASLLAHDDEYALTTLASPFGPLRVPRVDRPVGSRMRVRILARDVSLARVPDRDSTILNVFECRLETLHETAAGQVLLRLLPPEEDSGARLLARVTRLSAVRLGLAAGDRLWARVKSVSLLE